MRVNDRREFLRIAAAAATAPLAGAVPPSVIRVGLLGTQHSHLEGKLKAMKSSPADYEVVSVCEPNAAARSRSEKNPHLPACAGSANRNCSPIHRCT